MLLSSFIMPFFAFLYFGYLKETNIEPASFYRWSAFGFNLFIILPFILGLLSTILMHDENRYDMLKQLWIVPVSKMGYFFSKFIIVLIYSICFMLITAVASVLFSVIPGYVTFDWNSMFFLLERCLEIAILTALSILPIMAISASQKGYILPLCVKLIYVFAGFLITSINTYLHPLSCISAIISRNGAIPGVTLDQVNIPLALICICAWTIFSVVLANFTLKRESRVGLCES